MTTRKVNLNHNVDPLELSKVESRCYENASEALRTAIDAGDDSGIAEGNPFQSVRMKLGLKPR